jgi:hypothetical protein
MNISLTWIKVLGFFPLEEKYEWIVIAGVWWDPQVGLGFEPAEAALSGALRSGTARLC